MPYLTTRAELEIKQAFRKKAKAKGLNESELLRRLVLAEIGKSEVATVAPEVDSVALGRFTVRLPRFLLDAAKLRAESKGMVPSRWIAALVQSNLTSKPVMTDAELSELKASSRELAAIGRNINQIARVINETFWETEKVRLDKLAELSKAVIENRAAIRALVRASQNSWEAT